MKAKRITMLWSLPIAAGILTLSAAQAQQTSTTEWNVLPTDPITPGDWSVGPWTAGVPTTDSLAGILNGDTVAVNTGTVTDLEQILVSGNSTLNIGALIGTQGTNAVPAVIDPPSPAVPATGFFVGNGTLNMNAGGQLVVNGGGNFSIGQAGAGVLNLKPDGYVETDRIVILGTTGGSATINQTGGGFIHTGTNFRLGANNGPATYNLSGGSLDLNFLQMAFGSNAPATMNQSGGDVTITSGETAIGWDGKEGGNATYNLTGGTFTAMVARMRIGIGLNGPRTHLFNQTGGTVNAFKIEIGEKIVSDSTYAISGGELTVTSIPSIIVGSNSDGFGKLNISGTATVNVKGINLGNNTTASGTVTMSGGTVNSTDRIRLRTGTVAMTNLFDQTGGTVNCTNRVDIGDGTNASATCIYQISGGALNMTGGDKRVLVGFGATSATGTFTMSGTATVDANLVLAEGAGAKGTVNLNGGTLITSDVKVGTGVAADQILNLNGVTIKARSDAATLLAGNITTASLQSGGVTFDSNGFSVSTSAVMTGPGGLTKMGAGTLTVNSVQAYTGDTKVTEGTLKLTQPYLADNGDVHLFTGTVLDLTYAVAGTDTIRTLFIDGVPQPVKTYGGTGTGADTELEALMTGNSRLQTTSAGVTTIPPVITSITVSGATATITMTGAPGTTYLCKFSDDLVTPFAPIATVPAIITTDGGGNASFTVDASVARRFYIVGKD
jgi:autotransporter-associated beta strand protein